MLKRFWKQALPILKWFWKWKIVRIFTSIILIIVGLFVMVTVGWWTPGPSGILLLIPGLVILMMEIPFIEWLVSKILTRRVSRLLIAFWLGLHIFGVFIFRKIYKAARLSILKKTGFRFSFKKRGWGKKFTDDEMERINNPAHRLIDNSGAIIENGHFVYSSGRHGSVYIDHYSFYRRRALFFKLCRLFVDSLDSKIGRQIDMVVGPDNGGIVLAVFVAECLEKRFKKRVASFWAKKEYRKNGEKYFNFPEAFKEKVFQKRILVVDDVITTGGTLNVLIELSGIFGCKIIGCGCLWNRGEVVSADLYGVPLFSLFEKKLEDWSPSDCPLCKNGMPKNTQYGHGLKQ